MALVQKWEKDGRSGLTWSDRKSKPSRSLSISVSPLLLTPRDFHGLYIDIDIAKVDRYRYDTNLG